MITTPAKKTEHHFKLLSFPVGGSLQRAEMAHFRKAPKDQSPGLTNLKVSAARAPPRKSATRKIQMLDQAESPMMEMPRATAGLKAPPEMLPTAKAPVMTVMPMAS